MSYVIIGGWSSKCSACGGNADYYEDSHISGGPKSMWSSGSSLSDKNGCGAVWDEPAVSVYGELYDPAPSPTEEATPCGCVGFSCEHDDSPEWTI